MSEEFTRRLMLGLMISTMVITLIFILFFIVRDAIKALRSDEKVGDERSSATGIETETK
ncbi:MAG: hypothetical protein GY696_24210 [Gammaproteobacteria bacterium]|nr:hypothetical protein [Gammaproteobacteria bacterium]